MTYTIAIRPFHDRDGDFGRVKVHTGDDTEFEVNEVAYAGPKGCARSMQPELALRRSQRAR